MHKLQALLLVAAAVLLLLLGGTVYLPNRIIAANAEPTPVSSPPPDCAPYWQWLDTPFTTPRPYAFYSVDAVSENEAWGFGDYDTGSITALVERWDGQVWHIVDTPYFGDSASLIDSTVISTSNIWAVGIIGENHDSTAAHWDGITWSAVRLPQISYDDRLFGIAATSANDIWAVGSRSEYSGTIGWDQTLTLHWDGQSWQEIPSPNVISNVNNALYKVVARDANDVWAIGSYRDYSVHGYRGFMMHWDGVSWQLVPLPYLPFSTEFYGLAVLSSNDIWVSGRAVNGSYTPLLLHWDGSTWQQVPTPSYGDYSDGVEDLVALSANDIWGVGDFWVQGQPHRTWTIHWDGTSWQTVSSPNNPYGLSNILLGVSGTSAINVLAVGHIFVLGAPSNIPLTIAMHYSVPDGCPSPTPNPTATAAPTDTDTPTSPPTQTATPPATNTPLPQPTNTSVPLPTDTPPPPATATPCTMSYSDVPAEYWAYGYIKYLACAHLTSGYPDGTYRPNTAISRAELSRIVALAYGVPLLTPAQPSFGDVPASYWAYSYIEGLHAAGVISGYSDGSFRPNAHISRAEIVKLVVAASGTPQYTGAFTDYPDVPQSHWAYSYIKTASHQQWVGGYPDGHFGPNTPATRAELAKTVYLALVFPHGRR